LFLLLIIITSITNINAVSSENSNSTLNKDFKFSNDDVVLFGSDMYIDEKPSYFNDSFSNNEDKLLINNKPLDNKSINYNDTEINYNQIIDEKEITDYNNDLNSDKINFNTEFKDNKKIINNISSIGENSTIYILEDMDNEEIQDIIDLASENSTIVFIGEYYNNISILISKQLNIISYVGTTLNGKGSDSVFKFKNSHNSKISGFKIAKGLNGIEIINSSNIRIFNNLLYDNTNGILLNNVLNINIFNNSIFKNKYGIILFNSKNSFIMDNNISNNYEGILVNENNEKISIKNNLLSYNERYTINLNKDSINFEIIGNKIIKNEYGINVNSKVDGLNVLSNLISENSNEGISINEGYRKNNGKDFVLKENSIFGNGEWELQAKNSIYYDDHSISFGYNWFGGIDYTFLKICHKINVKLYSMVLNQKDSKVIVEFVGGENNLPNFDIVYTYDGKNFHSTNFDGSSAIIDGLNKNGGSLSLSAGLDSKYFKYNSFEDSKENPSLPNDNDNINRGDINNNEANIEYNNFNPQETNSTNSNNNAINPAYSNEVNLGRSNSNDGADIGSSSTSSSNAPSNTNPSSDASSKPLNSENKAEKESVIKKIEIDDEIIRATGIGTLIILIILSIIVYYSKDIKIMLSKRRKN